VVAPEGGAGPGVLVLHGWWGLTPFFRRVCDRLADAGFVAMAPDLYGDGRTADTPDEAEALLASADPNLVARLVLASVATLRNLPITSDGPIGVLGFSMGGSWALWGAARAPEHLAATVVFYATQEMDLSDLGGAVLGHFAEHDEFVSEDDAVMLEADLHLLGKPVRFHRYPGTSHWFFEDDRTPAFDAEAADAAWARTIEFLRTHLPADGTAHRAAPADRPDDPVEASGRTGEPAGAGRDDGADHTGPGDRPDDADRAGG
jgi:carboxymethylenebutenolidase